MIEKEEALARSHPEARLLCLLALATVTSCAGGDGDTSLLLNVALAPGVTDVPEELRVFVRHDAVAV
jgi:hypothetical protein